MTARPSVEPGASPAPRTPRLDEVARPGASPTVAWWRTAVIGAVAFAGALALLVGVWLFTRPLALVFAAIVIAQALAVPVGALARRLPRALAVVLVYLALILALVGVAWLIVPRIVADAEALASRAPGLFARGQELLDRLDAGAGGQLVQSVERLFADVSGLLIQLPVQVFSAVAEIVLVLFMSAYWLISAPRVLAWVRSLLPAARANRMHAVLTECGDAMGGYVRGQVISMAVIGTLAYIGLSLIGVDFALVLAFLAAIGEIVPILGPVLAAVPAVAVALLDSLETALIVVVFYVVLQQFESNILIPQVMHHQAQVPPMLALVAIFAGAAAGGILGALIAIPMAAALKVLVVRVAAPAIRRWTGAAEEAGGDASGMAAT